MFGVIKDAMRRFIGRIIEFVNPNYVNDFEGYIAVGEDGKIKYVGEGYPNSEDIVDYSDFIIMQGFVDAHSHISQINSIGKVADNLLDWLNRYIFREEEKFRDEEYAKEYTEKFFREVLRNGTTTIFGYSSPYRRAVEIAFEVASRFGLRAVIGQVLMDRNVPESMIIPVDEARKDILEISSKWNGYDDRIFYAVTPRFAVSCSKEMLKMAGEVARERNLIVQSHISEQKEEVEEALREHSYARNYAEVYEKNHLLTNRTFLAHGVHLSDEEIETLARYHTKIVHCPSSNFFLHSGIMEWKRLENKDIDILLGSDVAAGPSLSMFEVIKDAYYANKLPLKKLFYHATTLPMEILGIKANKFCKGYDADFIVVRAENRYGDIEDILSELVFKGDDRNIVATYVKGRKVWEAK